MINRRIAAALLAKKFINDYDEVVKNYETSQQIEPTGHLLKVIELMQEADNNGIRIFRGIY